MGLKFKRVALVGKYQPPGSGGASESACALLAEIAAFLKAQGCSVFLDRQTAHTGRLQQLQALGAAFALHPLALEDVLHREARAKSETFNAHQFVVLNVLDTDPEGGCSPRQVGFFLGPNWLISFCEGADSLFEPVRRRIRVGGKMREQGADYLLYALADVVDGIRGQLTDSLRTRLMNMAERAAELGNGQLIERLQRAVLGLERDEYPDVKHLQASIKQEHEAQRLEQVDELHRLSLAAGQFSGEESPRAVQIRQLLVEAHEQLERGALASQLARASELLDALKAEADERLQSVPRRLDAALVALDKVAALNSDDVGTARRILSHLDSQREALPRLSPGLQLQLEASLTSAERLLEKLQGEFEATRLVADELVSGGLLDGVLGMFRTGSEESNGGAALVESPGALTSSPQAQLDAFLGEEAVTAAALLDAGGELTVFHPRKLDRLRPLVNLRTHRKIVVIDGRTGMLGGINISDAQNEHMRPSEAWRDTHLILHGSASAEIPALLIQPLDGGDGPRVLAIHQHNNEYELGKSEVAGFGGGCGDGVRAGTRAAQVYRAGRGCPWIRGSGPRRRSENRRADARMESHC